MSRKSVRSFWVGFAGIAILIHLSIALSMKLNSGFDHWLFDQGNGNPMAWVHQYLLRCLITKSLIPCMVVCSIVPILFGRCGLAQRFSISIGLAITSMNYSIRSPGWYGTPDWDDFKGELAICGCWLLFPILFLMTPLKTPQLRLIAATCLLVLTVCVSVINMNDLRLNHEVVYWQFLYVGALCYALLRRNWGQVAFLEADTTHEHIERTSSRTMLELMMICGVSCVLVMSWLGRNYNECAAFAVMAVVLGLICVNISLMGLRMMLQYRHGQLIKFLFWSLGMVAILAISAVIFVSFEREIIWQQKSFWLALPTSPPFYLQLFAIATIIAWLQWVITCLLLGLWIQWCGWSAWPCR